ncbi:NAD(P)H-flavin oxidoreductase [Thermosulfidibacter takaii ABI70S6]|uniref:NAD(P)H-flavin oxidoreductase n=1 Tax=Thermosulfidibacter takaii (strain DSM 17441 / JCM 13301 / NBRC 103674 / ABI70S6) TaxID=1298851 RepID=A0A0S3QU84_THET7|nr:nitroreductase family protein [Thermosulfidibacter takaii]BAT71893.1 NAD(P)H-flavin oxidoreductase [Thermosulfidibacter takaii ABI70S6]
MELREAILGRRSVRKYKSNPVPKEVIEDIMNHAIWAPSGMNRQNWYFIVATGPWRDKVVEICKRAYQEYIGKKVEKVFQHKPKVIEETKSFFATLGGAPVVILAFAEPGPESEKTDIQSVAAAIQNLLLLAYEKGLGTCWMTGPISHGEEFKKLFGIEDKNFVALITLGYPDEKPKAPPRRPNKVKYVGFED